MRSHLLMDLTGLLLLVIAAAAAIQDYPTCVIPNTNTTTTVTTVVSITSTVFITSASTLKTIASLVGSNDTTPFSMQPSSTFRSNISSTDSASSTAATPSNCTEHGGFVLNFDDIPALSADNNSTVTPMPIFSPYHHFYFSEGFMVVPPPTDPYLPSSGKLLLEFFPTVDQKSTELSYTGSVGNGPTETLTCFNFNLLGVSLGCDSLDAECDWQFTGYRYDSKMKFTEIITTLHISTPACVGISAAETCVLIPVKLNHTFENLTSISINVTVSGESKIWWMDDLRLSWNDDSCDAGLCRQKNI